MTPVLDIQELVIEIGSGPAAIRPVDGVSLSVPAGGSLGIVGESGCGKTMTALALLRLVSAPARIASGRILYRGADLLALPEPEMRAVRGNRISMIFQEPMTCLNPVFTVGSQIAEAIRVHQNASRSAARERAVELLRAVRIQAPELRVDSYPHQLSGGMRQRVMIAIALACNPDVLIADEPTTALDVTVQAQILDLLADLRAQRGMALVLISHDFDVVSAICDEVAVMYAGRVVERAPVSQLIDHPHHPYSAGLLQSRPRGRSSEARRRLHAIPGMVPDPRRRPTGCYFRDRCERATPECAAAHPPLAPLPGGSRQVACYHPVEAA
jgi:peptide/nickel transport system ATP-binding protein